MSDEQRVTVPDEDVRIGVEASYQIMDQYGASARVEFDIVRDILEAVYLHWRRRELALRELVAEQQLDKLQADYDRLLYKVGDGSRQRDWQTMRELGQQLGELRKQLATVRRILAPLARNHSDASPEDVQALAKALGMSDGNEA